MADEMLHRVLRRQHARIAELASAVWNASARRRPAATRHLLCYLARHEAAEQAFVHPETRARVADPAVVQGRVTEEQEISEAVARVEQLDTESVDFMIQFGLLEEAVLDHGRAEEETELPALTRELDADEHARIADAMDLVDVLPVPEPGRSPYGELARRAHIQLAAVARQA